MTTRAPAPVDVPTTVVTTGPLDRAPAPVSPATDPELPRTPVPVLRPAAVAPAPAPTPYRETATPTPVLPIEEEPVDLTPPAESEDRNIIPADTPRYVTVLDDGTVVVSEAAQLNFSGSGVSVIAQGPTANIVITGGSGSSYTNANVAAFLAAYGSNTISTTGNITAGYFVGNGSQLTGLPTGYSNANVAAYLPTYTGNLAALTGNVTTTANVSGGNIRTAGTVSATGNITGNYFFGNGSQLTGISAGSTGNLEISGTVIDIAAGAPDTLINITPSGPTGGWAFLQLPTNATANTVNTRLHNDAGNVEIGTGDFSTGATNYTWIFDTTGNLIIPNDIVSANTIIIDNRASGNTADIQLFAADDIILQARDRSLGSGSEGGDINILAGDSAEDGDSSGGDIIIEAGRGGAANVDLGGAGGFVRIEAGLGGDASTSVGGNGAEDGGSLTLNAGDAGSNNGNIVRGANGGNVFIEAGYSTGNTQAGGNIVLTTGTGGPNGAAGVVQIITPSSDLGAGGTWTFNANGNLILPATGNINGADGQSVRLQSVSEGVVQSSVILNPNFGLTRLESWDNENFEAFTGSDWSSATYVADEGGGYIAFLDAPNILNLANSIETSRLALQVNGGAFLPGNGFNTSGNNITFFVITAPVDSPETVIDFTMAWVPRSRMEMDYDEGDLNIQAQDLNINITSNQEIDIQSSNRIRLENSSTVNGITISTDTANTFKNWTFDVAGNLTLPRGGAVLETNIPYGGLSGNTIALAPSGGTSADQQLLIYPTTGADANHLHLTSGNLYNTELFLGNDDLYVKLANTGNIVINTNDNAGNTAQWAFGTAGTILNSGNLTLQTPNGVPGAVTAITNSSGSWESNPRSNLATTGGEGSGLTVNVTENGGYASTIAIATAGTGYSNGDTITVTSGSSNATFTISVLANGWTFDTTGNLTLPIGGDIVGQTADNLGSLRWLGNSSGDGNGYTTMQLIPDATLTGSDQYLIVDPTAPGHIHIRAGGTQDNSSADLILGGENSFVKIAAGANSDVFVRSDSNDWRFGTDGVLTLPAGEGVLQSTDDTISLVSLNTSTGNANSVYLGTSGGLGFYDQATGGNWLEIFRSGAEPQITVPVGRGNLNIQTASGNTLYNWTFGDTGNLTLPGNTFAVNYANGTPVSIGGSSYGDSNVVTLLGSFGSNTVSTTGNITGGNLTVGSGTITGGNVNGATFNGNVAFGTGTVGGSGNIDGGNISATGNVTGGNISTTGRVSATGNIVTGGQIQSSAFTGGNIFWAANNRVDFQGAIKVGGTGQLLSPGGAASITLNNNGANIPIVGVTNTTNSTSTTSGALIVSGGAGVAGNVYVGGNLTTTGTINSTGKIGYASGSSVTQTTNRGTSVTINTLAGTIVTTSIAMVASEIDTFAVINSSVDPNNDIVLAQIVSPNFGVYDCVANPSGTIGGSSNGFYINIINISGFTTSDETITIRFMVIKSPNA